MFKKQISNNNKCSQRLITLQPFYQWMSTHIVMRALVIYHIKHISLFLCLCLSLYLSFSQTHKILYNFPSSLLFGLDVLIVIELVCSWQSLVYMQATYYWWPCKDILFRFLDILPHACNLKSQILYVDLSCHKIVQWTIKNRLIKIASWCLITWWVIGS